MKASMCVPALYSLYTHPIEFYHLDFFPKCLLLLIISALPSGADQVLLMEGLRLCICSKSMNARHRFLLRDEGFTLC